MTSDQIHFPLPASEISFQQLKSSFRKIGGCFILIFLPRFLPIQFTLPARLFCPVHFCLDLIHSIHKYQYLRNHLIKLRRDHIPNLQS